MTDQSNQPLALLSAKVRPRGRLTCCIALLLAFGSQADGQVAKTRKEVRSELAEAQRAGDVIPAGESGLTLRQRHPLAYPAPTPAEGMTREQVQTQLGEAIRTGDLIEAGDAGQRLRDLYPGRYPASVAAAGKTRMEVRREVAEAIRTGDTLPAGEGSLTLRERDPQRYGSVGLAEYGTKRKSDQ